MDDIYIKKVLQGDKEAFRYFIKNYKDMAFSLALSIVKDEFEADDIVQEAFIRAYQNLRSFSYKSKFRTWFYRIVLNEAFKRRQKQARDFLDFQPGYDAEIADDLVMPGLKEEEQRLLINQALMLLQPNESLALRLFYLEEQNVKDVCDIAGWTEANTKVILHRARKKLALILHKLLKRQ